MSQRITFSNSNNTTVGIFKKFCRIKGISLSSGISFVMDATAPLLEKIISHHNDANEIEKIISQAYLLPTNPPIRSVPVRSQEEYYLAIWNTHIRYTIDSLDHNRYKHNSSNRRIGNNEKKSIRESQGKIIEKYNAKKGIFIYIDRRISYAYKLSAGHSNLIMIKETSYDGVFFDFSKMIIVPILELITLGIDEAVSRKNDNVKIQCICWIPVYYINNKALIIPIVHEDDASALTKNGEKIIIVEPFKDEIDM
ncbi:hypothetical protein [Yersinia intermedia]|uniref:hypothetical protein n=1 Tax=Yersinia intermedia TaxID=631 RepID=UPI001CFC6D28|nr:hypothetical protein [Yersinia intermedia]MCB5313312.1 hypothetical protein [Yersinia intermedia]